MPLNSTPAICGRGMVPGDHARRLNGRSTEKRNNLSRSLHGFTLVELLVVIAIIGVLVALLLPAVQAARESARRTQCANNFKQVGLGLQNYHAAYGFFPTGLDDPRTKPGAPVYWGWSVYLLSYIEQQALFDSFDLSYPEHYFSKEENRVANATRVSAYLCPTEPSGSELVDTSSFVWPGHPPREDSAQAHVCGVADSVDANSNGYELRQFPEVDGIFGTNGVCKIANIEDGTSNTLIIGEVTGKGLGTYTGHFWSSGNVLDTRDGINGPFTAPGGTYPAWAPPLYSLYSTGFASFHPGGCHFALADGSVRFLSENISSGERPAGQPPSVLYALTTRAGGEPVSVPE